MEKQESGGWYFGWNIVGAATVLTLLTVGLRMGVGPFFLPIADTLGFTRSTLSSIVALGMLCYGLAMPLAGYLVGTRGTRFVLLTGTAIVVLSIIWTVYARGPIEFLLSFGVALSIGLGFTSPVALTPVISRWFTRQRGMALFFLSTGSMAGIALMTPTLTFAISAVGWRETLLGFAALFALLTVPMALFVMRDEAPEHTDLLPHQIIDKAGPAKTAAKQPAPNVRAALNSLPFWQVALGLFACGFSMNLLGTHGVPMLMDHGFDATTSSLGIGLIGLVAIFSTLVLGRMSDLVERRAILAAIYLVRGLGFFALVMVGAHWELYAAATLGGIAWAGSIALSSAILADVYGVRLVGVLYGLVYLGHQVGGMISSWLGGWAYETFGTHWVAFGSSGTLLLAAALISLRLPARGLPRGVAVAGR
ncbi:MFS transporter [Achromobacter sp. GD03932]|uniref:MFS transporter n=1 Tax=Achromobacter sp. GD03932 TaxID=2975407 RepID=UPI00244CB6B6|nr:MFS transporter [Achromobacter sp. GD03932]MDH1300392.1 MFS transporter [Achromobacter sp. GD03932]